jgi:hypothetical protein
MTLRLTPEQAALFDQGGFSAWRIEEDMVELADRQHLQEPLIVLLPDGTTAFAVSQGTIH